MTVKRTNNQRAKIDDVARVAGVSTATVSRVINGTGTVSPATQKRVHEAIRELRFVAHGSARGLAGTKTRTVGLVMPALNTFFFASLIRGINESIEAHDYSLLMYSVSTPASMRGGKPLPLGDHNTDGLIVFTDFVDDYSIQFMYEQKFPIVMLHRTPPVGLAIPIVMFRNEEGAYKAVDHLIRNGKKRIVFLKGPEGNEDSRQRELGYKRALEASGISLDTNLISRGGFAVSQAKSAIEQLISDGIEFDAVFAGDDNAALGTLEILQEYRLRVPEDVAIIGFNDDYMAQYLNPPLTTIKAPIYESGFLAGEKLLRLIKGREVKMESFLDTELIIRESSGGVHE